VSFEHDQVLLAQVPGANLFLSAVQGIARSHSGVLTLDSEPGQGSPGGPPRTMRRRAFAYPGN